MSTFLRAGKRFVFWGFLASLATNVAVHAALIPQGGEYPIVGARLGDQVFPQVSLSSSGGLMVWQDNYTDGDGLGISAVRLTPDGLASPSSFKVNEKVAGDQENAQVAMLKGGGAVVVWQGGTYGFQDIFARFLKPDGTFATGDIQVNTYSEQQQMQPSVAALSDGNAVVVWGSFGQDGHMQGVFGQVFTPAGQKVGEEFQVNETTMFNQRTAVVAGLKTGGFVTAWISEKSRGITTDAAGPSGAIFDPNAGRTIFGVDVYARLFSASGSATGSEFLVNTSTNVCANPSIAASTKEGFAILWGEDDSVTTGNSWDVYARAFNDTAQPLGPANRVNVRTFGDQFAPKIAANATGYLATWTSLAQDGSMDGVFARALGNDGVVSGGEVQVNTTTINKQIHPAAATDGQQRVLVVWSSFAVGTGFDLFAQRFGSGVSLPNPQPPIASGLSSSRILVTWPALPGFEGVQYELYVDDAAAPLVLSGNYHTATGFAPASSHRFRVVYRLADGTRSSSSSESSALTWGEDANGDGLPDDWQALYWGDAAGIRPGGSEDSDGDGATNFMEFLAGTNPRDGSNVLKMNLQQTSQGLRVEWSAQAGSIYQLQESQNSTIWSNVGSARFATGASDSVLVQASNSLSLYRVVRIR